jgi:hypothetical protein
MNTASALSPVREKGIDAPDQGIQTGQRFALPPKPTALVRVLAALGLTIPPSLLERADQIIE